MKKLKKIRELEEKIEDLEKNIKELKERTYKLSSGFTPLNLLKITCEICSYEKDDKIYYYLKRKTNLWNMSRYMWFSKYDERKDNKDIISPDFKSTEELYIWIFENYKKLNKKEEESK